jgi:hypothetical protein
MRSADPALVAFFDLRHRHAKLGRAYGGKYPPEPAHITTRSCRAAVVVVIVGAFLSHRAVPRDLGLDSAGLGVRFLPHRS